MDSADLREYVENLFGEDDPLLRTMRDEAEAQHIPTIQVPFALGRTLEILVRLSGAREALEIGTLFGYSGILIARALAEGGTLVTLEASAKHAEAARRNFARAGVADRVDLREGSALELLPTLAARRFDFIFIDADKVSYPEYLQWAVKLAHPGTVIVADNLWRGGAVAAPDSPDNDALARFNRDLASEESLVSVILPRLDPSDAFSVSVVR
jgi:predicted O-methyltransferase YrrM